MHLVVMETAAILVHGLNRFSLRTKMVAMAVAKLLLCCDIICKCDFFATAYLITEVGMASGGSRGVSTVFSETQWWIQRGFHGFH